MDRGVYALADGGFNASLRDYARVGLLYLNDGVGNGKQLIPVEWVRETFNDGDREAFLQFPCTEPWPRGTYKNQFWIRDLDRGQIMARGVFGQTIYIDRTEACRSQEFSKSLSVDVEESDQRIESVNEQVDREL